MRGGRMTIEDKKILGPVFWRGCDILLVEERYCHQASIKRNKDQGPEI